MDFLLPHSLQEPMRRLIGKEMNPGWLNNQWFCDRGIAARSLNCSSSSDVLRETLCRTIVQNTLPGLLRYEDRNSMAFSVESRVPFLTPQLVNFLLSLPEQYIIAPDGTSKAVFRKAMRGLVPDAILDRRDKIGFATPEQKWLKKLAPWVDSLISSDVAEHLPCLRLNRVQEEWASIAAGRRPFSAYVWRWLNLIQWTKQFQVQWQ
jgi:asparagine synthase (glutamine-hydrolysing)